jgi:hypothetical protein
MNVPNRSKDRQTTCELGHRMIETPISIPVLKSEREWHEDLLSATVSEPKHFNTFQRKMHGHHRYMVNDDILEIIPKAHAMKFTSNKLSRHTCSPQRNEPFCSVSDVNVLHVKTVSGKENLLLARRHWDVCSTERSHYCHLVTFANKPPYEESNDRQERTSHRLYMNLTTYKFARGY